MRMPMRQLHEATARFSELSQGRRERRSEAGPAEGRGEIVASYAYLDARSVRPDLLLDHRYFL